MAKAKTKAAKAVVTGETAWGYGIRTWDAEGRAYNGFQWDLTPGVKTEAPDWRKTPSCGHGLHCNPDGWGDWALLDLCVPGKIIGIVRYDTALAVEIDGGDKIKAPWMEVVMTTREASPGAVYGFISQRWRAKMAEILAAAGPLTTTATGDSGHASATGDSGHASATGYSGHASATGYSGHASATGDSGHASATGDSGHASATGYSGHASATGNSGHASVGGRSGIAFSGGIESTARATEGGAIMLAAWEIRNGEWTLVRVFAGMVGETHGDITIKPGVSYRLNLDGTLQELAQ